MDTIDKIRAEIERQMKYYDEKEIKAWDDSEQGDEDALWYQGHRNMCAKLLSFLDTLKEPVSEDLEEAADDHIRKVADAAGHPGWDWETQDIADAFKAGAEWQKAKMMEGATYNELMELYKAIRDELVKRHRDVPVNIKEEQ